MKTNSSFRLVFHGKQQVELEPFELPEVAAGQVKVKVHCTLMSTGTENIVFNRLFDEGTHWDKWVKYPFYPGYAAGGEVESVGDGVETLKPGDRVVFRGGHASHAVVNAGECYPVPAEVPLSEAVWFALAKIAFHGAVAANYRLGDRVLIIGAGPIGQMSLRWARAAGALKVLVADPLKERETIALTGGASAYISSPAGEAREEILEADDGCPPNVVIDSTGHPAVFAAALDLAGKGGRVVILGDTGQPARQTLTGDVMMKGLSIVGAHDGHQIPGWDQGAITGLFFSLVRDGRFSLGGLNTHTFVPDQCVEAYTCANRDRSKTMGILFNWKS
ncbi:MAG: zinc-binding dehydrogenase [Verrucomicrobiota bacterium JB024]|nr:zinc-binding dehydrogenase [Verrucomicrobiota bacterium JB024]